MHSARLFIGILTIAGGTDSNAQIYSARFGSEDIWLYDDDTGVRIGTSAFVPAQAGLDNPHGILDRGSDILVASWTHEIQRYDRVDGSFLGNFVGSAQGLNNPVYLEAGPDGLLYVSSQGNDRVYRYPQHGTTATDVDGGPWISSGTLDGPSGFDWSPDGSQLYVAGRFSTNVVAYNAITGAVEGEFSTSNSSDSTFGLVVDDASGDLFVAVDGNVVRFDLSGGFPVAGPAPPSTPIAIPGNAIGLEPHPDGSSILVAAGTNLYAISLADNSVSGPFFTTNDGSVHNFFHVSEKNLPPRSVVIPFSVFLLSSGAGGTSHLATTFTFSETVATEEAALQLSPDLITWEDAAVYVATGTDLFRDAAANSMPVGTPIDNGDSQTITERMTETVAAQEEAFLRVLRRDPP